jgi:hypothetical protein
MRAPSATGVPIVRDSSLAAPRDGAATARDLALSIRGNARAVWQSFNAWLTWPA